MRAPAGRRETASRCESSAAHPHPRPPESGRGAGARRALSAGWAGRAAASAVTRAAPRLLSARPAGHLRVSAWGARTSRVPARRQWRPVLWMPSGDVRDDLPEPWPQPLDPTSAPSHILAAQVTGGGGGRRELRTRRGRGSRSAHRRDSGRVPAPGEGAWLRTRAGAIGP